MAWFLVIEIASGRLFSEGTVLAAVLPAQFKSVDIGTRPADDQMWDEATETFVARPLKVVRDRVDDILEDPVIALLSQAAKDKVRSLVEEEFRVGLRLYNVATGKDTFP